MSALLEALAARIREQGYPVYAVSVMESGSEPETAQITAANPCQDCYSVAKLFVVTAIGILYDHGMLSPDERVTDVLAAEISDKTRAAMDPDWGRVTLDMALTHRLALPGGFLDIDCIDANTFGSDYLAYMLTHPLTGRHGGERCYTDGAFYLLARCAEARAGMRLDAFLWRELFAPLGYREAAWSCCPMGHAMGATGLYIRTEDMAKLGEIYRTGGSYRGRRILSEEWVRIVRERVYELSPKACGAVGKGGMRGQMLAIFPDRVIAWHACGRVDTDDLLAIAAHS